MCQQSFLDAYQTGKLKELDEKWPTFFYEANIAFNVRHPTFIEVMSTALKASFEYRPPTYNVIRTTQIEPRRK